MAYLNSFFLTLDAWESFTFFPTVQTLQLDANRNSISTPIFSYFTKPKLQTASLHSHTSHIVYSVLFTAASALRLMRGTL